MIFNFMEKIFYYATDSVLGDATAPWATLFGLWPQSSVPRDPCMIIYLYATRAHVENVWRKGKKSYGTVYGVGAAPLNLIMYLYTNVLSL